MYTNRPESSYVQVRFKIFYFPLYIFIPLQAGSHLIDLVLFVHYIDTYFNDVTRG